MARARRGPQPDPWSASDQAEFRGLLRALQQWAGYSSLERLEEGAVRQGTSMPPSTANRALNNDKLPTAEFVRRFVVACDADVAQWTSARDTLHDLKYSRDTQTTGQVENSVPGSRNFSDPPDLCPYPGLAAFRPDQAQWFFGREEVTAELLGLLTDRMVGTGPLIVVGPSGTGKSSLLRAGLLAALSEGRLPGSRKFAQLVFVPSADPVGALGAELAAATGSDEKEIVAELSHDPQRAVAVIGKLADTGEPHSPRAVIVVDQFEEVFTLCPEERSRQVFIRALCAAAAPGGGALVVFGLRADHYGHCAAYPELIESLRAGQVLLGAMTNEQLHSAIEKPALAAGLDLETGLAEVMLRDLGQRDTAVGEPGYQPGALPLLSHALLATWQQREGRTLTLAGYRVVGGISGAITKTAERVYQMLEPGQQDTARSVLLRMIQLGDGTDDTRRRVERAQLVAESTDPAGVEKVLNALIDARLLTVDETTVTIVHEILLREWPRLRQWIDADREGLLLQQRLAEAAEAWHRDGRHESDLYRGHRLAAFRERLDAADPHLPALTNEFLRASVDRERADERGVVWRGRLRKLVAVLSALGLMAVMFAVQSRNNAIQLEKTSLSSPASSEAMRLRVSDRVLAAQLAVAAHHLSETTEARGAVLSALMNLNPPRRSNADSQTSVGTVAFSSDGRLLVAASGETRIWKLGDPPSLADPPIALPHHQQVRSAVFSHDDQWLATSSNDNAVHLWAVKEVLRGNAQLEPSASIRDVRAGPVMFRRDNRLLVTVGPTRETIQLWDLTTGTPRSAGTIRAHEREVRAMAISPDGRYLASAGSDGTAKLWDITTPAVPKYVTVVEQDMDDIYAVAFSPDGRILATANWDRTARLFDISNPKTPRAGSILNGHLGPVSGVAFSTDGKTLATTSQDSTARLWSIPDAYHHRLLAAPLAAPHAGDQETVRSAAFSPDGHTLALTSQGNDVRLWETDVDRAVTEICKTVTSSLMPDQWNRYFSGIDYEPTCPARVDSEFRNPITKAPAGGTSLKASHSGKCVAIKDDGALIGAPAHQVDCTGAPGENWTLHVAPVLVSGNTGDRIVTIVNAASDMCLESAYAERKFGGATQVVQQRCVPGNGAQFWILKVREQRADSADVRFLGWRSATRTVDDCFNINGEATGNGAYVVRWQCHAESHDNEIFRIHADAIPR